MAEGKDEGTKGSDPSDKPDKGVMTDRGPVKSESTITGRELGDKEPGSGGTPGSTSAR